MANEFISEVMQVAVQIQKKYGLPAAAITAQACLETGYGQYVRTDLNTGQYSYNLFNIKGSGPAGSVLVDTWEVYNGVKTYVRAYFRAYHTYAESFEDYVDLITGFKVYAPCLAAKDDSDEYARQLQKCGYATDPNYSRKLIKIMNTYNLREMAKEEMAKMAIEQWQKDIGVKALEELAAAGVVSDVDTWKSKIEENTPIWLFFEMLRRLNLRISSK